MPNWLHFPLSLAILAAAVLILFGVPFTAFWLWGAGWGILATLAMAAALYLLCRTPAAATDVGDAYALFAGLVVIGLGALAGLILAVWRLVA